ncbi:MAG: hypothetical protein IT437_08375 [Phycisphaerales bacterium]|nr:hypothetical protein [Phycisphaerales bacterium]
MDAAHVITNWLWPAAVGAIPVALVVALVCRTGWCRAVTRHALWLVVLACFLVTPLVPPLRLPVATVGTQEVAVDRAAPESTVDTRAMSGLAGWADRTEREVAVLTREVEAPRPVWSAGPSAERANATPLPGGRSPEGSSATLSHGRISDVPPAPTPTFTAPLPRPGAAAEAQRAEARQGVKPGGAPRWAELWIDTAAWGRWTPKVQALRDAFATLPPLPTPLWLGGGGLILAVIAGRTLRFRRVLARSAPAPASVRLMVQRAAKEIGLKRTPAALMTEQRVSPMVWCGLRCRLVLPAGLWGELDDQGRRAVILHELAHLRRRDHWVRWAELAASVAYWWHPVVWWVRGHLRDEADLCCDAWVTALLPRERRAYAMALVSTQSYLSRSSVTPPSVGMGVMTSSAERFARRLTMVMKARPNPRLSALGVIASLGLGIVASSSASLWACPPEDEKPVTSVSQPQKPARATQAGAPRAARAAEMSREAAAAAYAAAIADYNAAVGAGPAHAAAQAAEHNATAVAGRAHAEALTAARHAEQGAVLHAHAGQPSASRTGDSDARIRELEARLERLDAQIERLQEMLERSRNAPRGPLSVLAPAPAARGGGVAVLAAPSALSAPSAPSAPVPAGRNDELRSTLRALGGVSITTPRASTLGPNTVTLGANAVTLESPAGQPGDAVRVYRVSGGKLQALWNLMSRDDVPVVVSQEEGGIAVHGNEAQQRAFSAFIRIINPEGAGDEGAAAEAEGLYRIEVQNLDAVRGLHEQEVARAQEQLHRHAQLLAERYAEAAPRLRALRSLNDTQRQEIVNKIKAAEKQARDIKVRRLNRADEAKVLLERLHRDSQTIIQAQEAVAQQSLDQAAALGSRADGLEEEAARLEQQASDLADRADQLAEEAGTLEGEARAAAQQQVRELQAKSKEASKQARSISQQADQVRQSIEAMEEDADTCREAAEESSDACPECSEPADCPAPPEEAPEPLAVIPSVPVMEVPVASGVPTPPPAEIPPVLPPALPH